jgi:hypothetical protein
VKLLGQRFQDVHGSDKAQPDGRFPEPYALCAPVFERAFDLGFGETAGLDEQAANQGAAH